MRCSRPMDVGDQARPRKHTLRDVAAAAGVSIGTASNAFNRPDLISEGLRDRVFEAAARLGYGGPDPAARRLRTGRTGALGVIFTDRLPYAFDDEAAVLFLRGLANALENSGAGLLLIPTSPTREEGSRVVRGAAVDGFIVFSTPTGDPRLEAALARGLPTITVDEPLDVPDALHRHRRPRRRRGGRPPPRRARPPPRRRDHVPGVRARRPDASVRRPPRAARRLPRGARRRTSTPASSSPRTRTTRTPASGCSARCSSSTRCRRPCS